MIPAGQLEIFAMRAIRIEIDGQIFEQWEEAVVSRNLETLPARFPFSAADIKQAMLFYPRTPKALESDVQ